MVPGRTPTSGSGTGQSLPRLVSKCQTRGKGGFFRFWIHEKNQRAKKKKFFPLYSLAPLKGYQGEDIEIVLPGNLTVHDIDWLSVWCVQYKHNFGHVLIPKDLDVPPALGQTKITVTENRCSRSNEIPFCSIHASLNPFATKDETSRPWISLSLCEIDFYRYYRRDVPSSEMKRRARYLVQWHLAIFLFDEIFRRWQERG